MSGFITLHKHDYWSGELTLNVDEISSVSGSDNRQNTVVRMRNGDRFEPYESATEVRTLIAGAGR